MWQEYCVENGYEPNDMARFPNTPMVVSDFTSSLQVISTPLYLIKEALTAVKGLFEIAKEGILQVLQNSQMIAEALRASTTGVKRVSKYRTIWKLEVLLEHIRSGPPTQDLEWFPLMARTAALFMIFIPCRPVGAWRIDPRLERWAPDGGSVELLAKEKTDYGKGVTALLVQKGPVPNLCPLLAYCTIKAPCNSQRVGRYTVGFQEWCGLQTGCGVITLSQEPVKGGRHSSYVHGILYSSCANYRAL
jgi:hypothetical protein